MVMRKVSDRMIDGCAGIAGLPGLANDLLHPLCGHLTIEDLPNSSVGNY